MPDRIANNIVRFILLVLVQVIIIENVHFYGLFDPYIYPLFILLLPFDTPRWLQLVLGFAIGFTIDLFLHTPGLHASASVLTAFLRQGMLNLMKPPGGYLPEDRPTVTSKGFTWWMIYASILVFIHHAYLFLITSLNFHQLFFELEKIVISSAVALAIMIIVQYLFYRRKVRVLP